MANSRLNDWASANTVKISTRTSITWPAEIRQNLNQSRCSSTSISQRSDDVTVTKAKKQTSAVLSENTNNRLPPNQKPKDVSCTSTINGGLELKQQPCNTNEGQKAMFSHPTTNEGPKQTFSYVCTSEGPQASHAAEPIARTVVPPYQRRTAVSTLSKQHFCKTGPHSSFKRRTRGVSCPPEWNKELSTCPWNYDYVLYVWSWL